jgi:outer membrane biosynthesis protein TonB
MDAINERVNEGLPPKSPAAACKWRHSCYESGVLPPIEPSSLSLHNIQQLVVNPMSMFDTSTVAMSTREKSFEELCKWRRSCYETGIIPPIEQSAVYLSTDSASGMFGALSTVIGDMVAAVPALHLSELNMQQLCHYRLSCYETGIVPDLTPPEPVAAAVTTTTQYKHITPAQACKYRLSCIQQQQANENEKQQQQVDEQDAGDDEHIDKEIIERHRRFNEQLDDDEEEKEEEHEQHENEHTKPVTKPKSEEVKKPEKTKPVPVLKIEKKVESEPKIEETKKEEKKESKQRSGKEEKKEHTKELPKREQHESKGQEEDGDEGGKGSSAHSRCKYRHSCYETGMKSR